MLTPGTHDPSFLTLHCCESGTGGPLRSEMWGAWHVQSLRPPIAASYGGQFYNEAVTTLCAVREHHTSRTAHHARCSHLQRVFAPEACRGHLRQARHEGRLRDIGQIQEWRDVCCDTYVCCPSTSHLADRHVDTSIRNKDVFIVQSGSERLVAARPAPSVANSSRINDSVMELLIMISACKGGSAKSITGTHLPPFPWPKH
jgi:hypothetical protein